MTETIYRKDSKGKIRFLTIEAHLECVYQRSGILGTPNPVTHIKVCKPKNAGKSNATTAEEQAVIEMKALLVKNLKKDYSLTEDLARERVIILPMLAKSYEDHKHKIDWDKDEIFVQPKFDGMRSLSLINGKIISREGNEIETMDHIRKEIESMDLDYILDGELYVHGENFQTNMTYVKKYKKGLSERIKLHVYDLVDETASFKLRNALLKSITKDKDNILPVETVQIYSEHELQQWHARFLSDGYEGTMVRIGSSLYKINGRSDGLLKYKDFLDIDLPILDVIPCKVMSEWGEPIYHWPGATGHRMGPDILGSGTKMSHDQRKELLLNKKDYIGKSAKINYFELSDKGVPRFPVTVGINLDR